MINVFFHNISTNEFMDDGVVLNNSKLPAEDTDLGIIFHGLDLNNDFYNRLYIAYINAFPWIEEKLDPLNWQNKTYIPSLLSFPSNGTINDSYKTPKQILDSLNSKYSKSLHKVLSDVGYYSDYIAADTYEEKLCWLLLSVAMQTKFYTSD